MKTLITFILCVSLIGLSFVQSTNGVATGNPHKDPPVAEAGLIEVVIGLTVIAIGAAIVIKVYSTFNENKPVELVLEKSTDHSTWIPVYTNTVVLNGTNSIEFFHEQMTDSTAFYRARRLVRQ